MSWYRVYFKSRGLVKDEDKLEFDFGGAIPASVNLELQEDCVRTIRARVIRGHNEDLTYSDTDDIYCGMDGMDSIVQPHNDGYACNNLSVFVTRWLNEKCQIMDGSGILVNFSLESGLTRVEMTAEMEIDLLSVMDWKILRADKMIDSFLDDVTFQPLSAEGSDSMVPEDMYGDVLALKDEWSGETVSVSSYDTVRSAPANVRDMLAGERPNLEEDTLLVRCVSGRQKLVGLVEGLVRSKVLRASAGRNIVLVVGANPGVLTRQLVNWGFHVHEIDKEKYHGHMDNTTFTCHTVGENTLLQDLYHGDMSSVAGVITDIAEDDKSGGNDTKLNFHVASLFKDNIPCVIKARQLPYRSGQYQILYNDGYEVRGCETYWYKGPTIDERLNLSTHQVTVTKKSHRRVSSHESSQFNVSVCPERWYHARYGEYGADLVRNVTRGVQSSHGPNGLPLYIFHEGEAWYQYVATRTQVAGRRLSENPYGRLILGSEPDMMVAKTIINKLGFGRSREHIQAIFNSNLADNVRGVDSGLLMRTPGSSHVLFARHEAAMSMGVRGVESRNDNIRRFFKHPLSGRLLKDMSAMRSGKDPGTLEKIDVLLPLTHKAILMSKTFFVLVMRLLRMWKLLGQSLPHGHEVESLLWELSSFGAMEDKLLHVAYKMEDLWVSSDTVRNYSRAVGRTTNVRNTWLAVLSDMSCGKGPESFSSELSAIDADICDKLQFRKRHNHWGGRGSSAVKSVVPNFDNVAFRGRGTNLVEGSSRASSPAGPSTPLRKSFLGEGSGSPIGDVFLSGPKYRPPSKPIANLTLDEDGVAHAHLASDGRQLITASEWYGAEVWSKGKILTESAKYGCWIKEGGKIPMAEVSNTAASKMMPHYLFDAKWMHSKIDPYETPEQIRNSNVFRYHPAEESPSVVKESGGW